MKKGETIELLIEYNKYPNVGVGVHEGTKISVKNTLAGQKILCRVTKKRNGKAEGRALELLERSPQECDSFCEHFNNCGGCFLQTYSYEKQMAYKLNVVKRLFEQAGIQAEIETIIASPEVFEYRNKMEFSFGDLFKEGPLTLGMHKKGRHHDVVTVDSCHICDGDFRKILKAVLDFAYEHKLPKYNKFTQEGFLKHLVVRKGTNTGDIMVALSATTTVEWDSEQFVKSLLVLDLEGRIESILHAQNDGLGDVVSGDVHILHGKDTITEKILGLSFNINLYSFFQTNTKGAELLYETAMAQIEDIEGKICFDLFSGTGTIGQIMALKAKKVIGIELIEDAVKMAKENAEINGIDNATFLCGDVFKVLNEISETPDVIVVDPPRVGMREKAVIKVAGYKVPEILYISCNPKTLVEDLTVFEKEGYHVKKVTLVDQFPWTANVEAIVLITRC